MRQLIIVLLSFCGSLFLSCQTTLTGKIIDGNNGEPLPFATIATTGLPYGTLSETDGTFRLVSPVTLVPETEITVSYLGYASQVLSLAGVSGVDSIILAPRNVDLPMAIVTAAAVASFTEIKLGRKEKKAGLFYQNTYKQAYQLASRVENKKIRRGVMTKIDFYFGKAAKGGKSVRLNFYAVDPSCDCPGGPLHASPIIPEKVKSGWNKFDLMPYQVQLPAEDFFIAFEWLGLSTMKADNVDFSVGIIYDKKAAPIYEKVGGENWKEAVERGAYRPLVRVSAKVE